MFEWTFCLFPLARRSKEVGGFPCTESASLSKSTFYKAIGRGAKSFCFHYNLIFKMVPNIKKESPLTSLERRASGNKQNVHSAIQSSSLSHQPSVIRPSALSPSPQPSAFSLQPSASSPQPSAISEQPSAFSLQPSASSLQPLAFSQQPAAFSQQPSAFSLQSCELFLSFFLS